MLDAPGADPAWFCIGACPLTGCFAQYSIRHAILGQAFEQEYKCCGGYFSCCCIKPGVFGEASCPEFCLWCEVCCCYSCALSANRMLMQDRYQIVPDIMDYKLIQFNNCVQCLAIIIDIAAAIVGSEELRQARQIVDFIAHVVFWMLSGCMTAQMHYELNYDGPPGSGGTQGGPKGAPDGDKEMER